MKSLRILLMMFIVMSWSFASFCQESVEPMNLMKIKEVVSQKKVPYVSYMEDEVKKGHIEKEAIYPITTDVAIPKGGILKVVFIDANGVETSTSEIELKGEAVFDVERLFETQDAISSMQELIEVKATDQGEQAYFIKGPLAKETPAAKEPSTLESVAVLAPVAASLSEGKKLDYEAGLWLLTSRTLGQAPSQQMNTAETASRTILKNFELPKNIK